jgi:Transposase DDE domain
VDPELVPGGGGRRGGRREWPRVARRELESRRKRQAEPIPRDREDRLFGALGRLEENHRVDLAANDTYERWRSSSRDTLGRPLKGNSKPYAPPTLPEGTINLSDPDSRVMRSKGLPHRQAYNVQTAVTEQQIILAAEISIDAPDFGHLEPMLDVTLAHLRRRGITEQPEAVVGDAGYWHTRQIHTIQDRGIEVLVPPDGAMREGNRPGWENGLYQQMREKLQTARGRTLYALRKTTIEPVFGQIKYNRRVDQFIRRGRAAVQSELRLVATTHNMLKLLDRRHSLSGHAAPPLDKRFRQTADHPKPRCFRIFQRPPTKGVASASRTRITPWATNRAASDRPVVTLQRLEHQAGDDLERVLQYLLDRHGRPGVVRIQCARPLGGVVASYLAESEQQRPPQHEAREHVRVSVQPGQ